MYTKNKKLTLHVRLQEDLLDLLSRDYNAYNLENHSKITFSEYVRRLLVASSGKYAYKM